MGEIHNGKDGAYPTPFHELSITFIITANPVKLWANHVSPAHAHSSCLQLTSLRGGKQEVEAKKGV